MSRFNGDPFNRDPFSRNRSNRDPFSRDPFNRDPFSRDPFNRDAFSRDPFNRDPFNRDPFSRDPFNMDLLSRDLCSTDPFSQDPFFRDLFCRDPFSTGSRMFNEHKQRLSKWLSEDDSIFKSIQSRNLLTMDEHCKLDSIQDPSEKSTKLLDLIQNKGSGVCNDFLTLLKEDMVNESRPELRQWITKVETYSCSSDVDGGRPEIKKWMVTVNTTPGSPGSSGAKLNEFKPEQRQLEAIQYSPSESSDANVSSNPPEIGNQTTTDTNVSNNPPQVGNQTSEGANVSSNQTCKENNVSNNPPQDGNQTRKATNVSSNPSEDDNALIKDNEQFLENNRAALIQKVKNVVEIADALKLISAEQRSKIQGVETDQDKMRLLLDNTTSKAAAKDLVDALLQHAKDVMDDLINAQ